MLKLKKGHKKKKGKKDKEEDLFDPESLARFKKELESKKSASGEGTSASTTENFSKSTTVPSEEDDEWARFKQLTAGIDNTLKKTSGDLDRIKTTSYFQKKVSDSVVQEKKVQWENVEKEEPTTDFHRDTKPFSPSSDDSDAFWGPPPPPTTESKPVLEELKFNEVEKEIVILDDGLFDTSYLDAIESGQIQLAYIPPDSPVNEDEEDPFDTSAVAEVVKKFEEEEVKSKRKVNLGCAVDFLTKTTDQPPPAGLATVPYTDKTEEIKKTKRGRPVHVDLLGFDTSDEANELTLGNQPLTAPIQETNDKGSAISDLLLEFESTTVPPQPTGTKNLVSNLDLLTQAEPDATEPLTQDEDDDAWFRTDNEPVTERVLETEPYWPEVEVDPFDTTVVEKLGLGKSELKKLEDELFTFEKQSDPVNPVISPKTLTLQKPIATAPPEEDFDFDPRKDESPPTSFHPLDIVHQGSTFDPTTLIPKNFDADEVDPFDTSSVSDIVIPGRSELRFLEEELIIRNSPKHTTNSEFLAEITHRSVPPTRPPPPVYHPLDAPDDCINEILELTHPPLHSQQTLPYSVTTEFDDPFDTSDVVDTFAPGKSELKELESELLNSTVDFIPPRVCPLKNFKVLHKSSISSVVSERQESLHPFDSVDGDLAEVEHYRPLSPQLTSGDPCMVDPFDTSAISGFLPGKFETRFLEEELATASHVPVRQLTLERTEKTFSHPPNIPAAPHSPLPEEKDPFDTSIADADIEPHHVPQYETASMGDAAIASNPFLSNEIFSFEPESLSQQSTQGENPFLSSMSSTTAAATSNFYGAGNPFADFVLPQTSVGVGFIGATESGVDSWGDMQTSYGSVSELELQPVPTATQDLLSTVTGALEATSDSLLDRLRYAQPSPVPQPPSPTPSPRTPSPDLLMGDEDLIPMHHPFIQPNFPKNIESSTTIDLMGLYNKPTTNAPPQTIAPQSFVPDFQPQLTPFYEKQVETPPSQAIEDMLDLALDMTLGSCPPMTPQVEAKPEVVKIVKPIEPAPPKQEVRTAERPPPPRPTQPPKVSPSRPPPPVPPSPRKEPPPPSPAPVQHQAPPAATDETSTKPLESVSFSPCFASATVIEPSSPFFAPSPVFTAPTPSPQPMSPRQPTSPFPMYDNFPISNAVEVSATRAPPPVPPSPRPQPVITNPPRTVDFDAFDNRFESVADGNGFGGQDAFGSFDGSNVQASSAWGDSGGTKAKVGFDDSSTGFGGDKFDEFLSLREPPPVPQSTPAKSRINSGSDDFDRPESNLSIIIRQKDKLDFNLDLVPSLAPPPKSPAISTGSAYSEDNCSFVPFLSSAKSATATGDSGVPVPRSDSQDSPQTPLFEEDQSQTLEDFPRIKYTGDGWEMQMRHPNKKKITGQRFWKKVYVRLATQTDIPTVQIFNSAKDKDPIQEIPLQPCYSVSDIAAQQFDQYGKIFTVKLQYIFYKERPGVRPGQITKAERITNKLSQFAAYAIQGDYQGVKEFGSDLKKLGLPLEHAPQVSQLVKLGTQNFEEMKQFSMVIEEALFHLPVHRDRALTYKSEEVQVTLVDEYYAEQDVTGCVNKQIARVRLYFLSFLSGSAEVELGINDMRRQGKEVVGRHDIIPIATEEWIRIEDIEFSSCVQLDVFSDTKMVKFKPPDACYIELLRFRVRPPKHRELPLQVKTVFTMTGHRVEMRCDILVPGFTSRKLGQVPCEDVMIRIPIPECWIYMFRVEKHFRYGSVKSAHRRSGKVKGIERFLGAVEAVESSLMEVTSGQAKYEHQHKAIVWRVSRLPKEGQGAYTTHSFFCHITLQSHEEIPTNLTKYCYVEFTMPHTTISHTVCRSVSVPMCDEPPEKCVKYLSRHEYLVEVEHTQGVTPATYNLAATVVKEEVPEVKPEEPMEGKALSDSDFSDD